MGAERLAATWRGDELLGRQSDDPPVAGKGSAIFLHISRSDYSPTAGCVAVQMEDMMKLLALIGPETAMEIAAG